MRFIGLTAGLDALIALITLLLLVSRRPLLRKEGSNIKTIVGYFINYLFASFLFLALIAVAMLYLTDTVQSVVVIFADIALWTALANFILLVFVERPENIKKQVLGIFFILAGLGSIYQILNLLGIKIDLGGVATYILSQMAPLLMYIVWIPSAILFYITAARTGNPVVKIRSVLFATGLILITYSWAARLLQSNPSFAMVSIASIIGFALLFGGVAYQKPKTTS